jgi:hypothetical protein
MPTCSSAQVDASSVTLRLIRLKIVLSVGLGCCSVNAWMILIMSSTLWFIESFDNVVQSGTIAVPSWQRLSSRSEGGAE